MQRSLNSQRCRTYLRLTAMVDNKRRSPVTTRNIGCLDPFEVLRLGPSPAGIVTQIQKDLKNGRLMAYMVQGMYRANSHENTYLAIIASEFVVAFLLYQWLLERGTMRRGPSVYSGPNSKAVIRTD